MQNEELSKSEDNSSEDNPSKDDDVVEKNTSNPSSEFLLSILRQEYAFESDRIKSLENRTGIFLALAGVLLVFITSTLKLDEIFQREVTSLRDATPLFITILLSIMTLISLIISIIFFVRVISIKTYKRIAPNSSAIENTKDSVEVFALALIPKYIEMNQYNVNVNNKKTKNFQIGIYLIITSVIMTVLTYCMHLFI